MWEFVTVFLCQKVYIVTRVRKHLTIADFHITKSCNASRPNMVLM